MKKIILSLLAVLPFLNGFAQLPNTSFETWSDYTSIWGYDIYVPVDTFTFLNPDGWTSVNQATGNENLGGLYLASQINDAQNGSYALRLETKTISISALGLDLVLPGFIANGEFYLNLVDALGAGGQLSPMQLTGAGTPTTDLKESISLYAKYDPIVNDTINDSLLVWAVLKKNGNLVAEARVVHGTTNGTYQLIQADFNYVSCETPDTLVVMIGSSIPDFSGLTGGNSGLIPGSVLLVDNITFSNLPNGFNFPPLAVNDETFTLNGATKTVAVLSNDSDCEGDPLSVSIPQQPLHGTALLVAGDSVSYTPDNGFLGVDSIYYLLLDGNSSSIGMLRISMLGVNAINEADENNFSVYPNPSNGILTIEFEKPLNENAFYTLLDAKGSIIASNTIQKYENRITFNASVYAKGLYFLKVASGNTNVTRKIEFR